MNCYSITEYTLELELLRQGKHINARIILISRYFLKWQFSAQIYKRQALKNLQSRN